MCRCVVVEGSRVNRGQHMKSQKISRGGRVIWGAQEMSCTGGDRHGDTVRMQRWSCKSSETDEELERLERSRSLSFLFFDHLQFFPFLFSLKRVIALVIGSAWNRDPRFIGSQEHELDLVGSNVLDWAPSGVLFSGGRRLPGGQCSICRGCYSAYRRVQTAADGGTCEERHIMNLTCKQVLDIQANK